MADGKVTFEFVADDSDLKDKLDDVDDKAKEAGGGLDGLGDSAKKAGKGFGAADVAIGSLISNGVTKLISAAGDAIASLVALADETREYREDMAKLEAAFKDAGHSTEAASKVYEDFYAILGESDRSVEAVNHLAELTDNQEDLVKWSKIAAGVTSRFGDSLPLEALTEAANETAKVGKTTGVLADALNWAGISEDKFNAQLEKCNSEQERAALITSTLNKEYEAAANEYNELTAGAQEARRATAELEAAQATLGATIEPLTTLWTQLKAGALSWVTEAAAPAITAAAGLAEEFIEARKETDLLSTSQRAQVTAAKTAADQLRSTAEAAAALSSTQMANVDYVKNNLLPQLSNLVEANGKVKKGEEARAKFILEELNNALGTEYTSLRQIVEANGEIKQSIYDVMEAKKAQILLEAYEESYRLAVEGVAEAERRRATQAQEIALQQAALAEAEAAALAAENELFEKTAEAKTQADYRKLASEAEYVKGLQDEAKKQRKTMDEKQAAFDESNADLEAYYNTIDGYQLASTAIQAGETDKAIGYLRVLSNGFMSAEEAREDAAKKGYRTQEEQTEHAKKQLEQQVIDAEVHLRLLEEEYASAQANMTEEQRTQAEARIKEARKIADDAKEEYKTVGGNITKGIAEGAEDEKWTLNSAMQRVVDGAIAAAKKAGIIKSPSRKARDQVGKPLAQGVAVGLEENTATALTAAQKMTNAVAAVMEKSAEKTKKSIEDRMKELVELGSKYDEEVAKVWTDLGNNVSSLMDAYNTELENKTKSIAASLGLWAVAEKNTEVTAKDLTDALGSQINLLSDYNSAIANLAGRGVDTEFLNEIKALGVDATGEIEALNSMSDEELAQYVEMWKEKSELARQAATAELETLKNETLAEISTLADGAVAEYMQLRADYEEQSKLLAEELSSAMKATGKKGYKELIAQLDDYTSAGTDLMDGVVTGIAMRSDAVAAAVSGAVARAIEAAKQTAGIASPSKVMRDEVGKNLALGLSAGWENEIDSAKSQIVGDVGDITAKVRATVSAENARISGGAGAVSDNGFGDLVRAVGTQTAGIASLASEYRRGTGSKRPIVIELNGRELGRAVVDVGGAEETRVGARLALT